MQERIIKKLVVGLIIIFALLFFCLAGMMLYRHKQPAIILSVDSYTIRQDEPLPTFEINIEYHGEHNLVLDESTGYTVENLLETLKTGEGQHLVSAIDNAMEGIYENEIQLSKELQDKFNYVWMNKINLEIKNGTVNVLNKHGDWEENRFRLLDGTYASGWMNFGQDTYYFDANGEYVTGECEINGNLYYFTEEGKFDTEIDQVNPNRPMIALTFDDGPGNGTMRLLEVLEEYDAKASFFMVGANVNHYPDTIRKMKELGCDLGNHTTNHARLTSHAPEVMVNEIQTTSIWVSNIVGEGTSLLRPPYGSVNEIVQANANAPIIMWSVDTLDWETKNAQAVRNHVLQTVKDGAIILMHDIHDSTIQAAEMLIPELVNQGYQLVTVSEMAKARGVQLENGSIYYHFYK